MRTRILRFIAVPAALAASLTAVSCGGGGGGTDMVLVGFNLPNIAGVPLNQTLIYTFSDNVDPASATPDTLQVITLTPGQPSFTFASILIDGNLVAELPRIPTFDDYSDSGMAPDTEYSVFLPVFPAVDTIKSTTGRPLVRAESFTFRTFPAPLFIESRRPLIHTPGPVTGTSGSRGDADGCLQNATNSLYDPNNPFQTGTDQSARLICLKNDGAPRVLLDQSIPTHDQRAVGTPSGVSAGLLDLGAIRIRFNEALDPLTVTPSAQIVAPAGDQTVVPPDGNKTLAANVQLFFVADADLIPLPAISAPGFTPNQIQVSTNVPVVIQDLNTAEVILVPTGPQKQGVYVINVKSTKDLAGNFLNPATRPSPSVGGYAALDAALNGKIPIGYRYYFRTLELPATDGSVTEGFGNNFAELTRDLFTFTTVPNSPVSDIPGSPRLALANTVTLIQTQPGQSTNANWNGTNRFLGLPNVTLNTAQDDGAGRLKAVFKPYMGTGEDGNFSLLAGSGTISSDTGSFDGDGIFEFESFNLGSGASLTVEGSKPLLILVRGACTIAGTIRASGARGRFGIDTDGSAKYTNVVGIPASGVGGTPGPGGGQGGRGAPQLSGPTPAVAAPGAAGLNLFGEGDLAGRGSGGASANNTNQGGGGGGYGTAGSGGSGATNGTAVGDATFARALALFVPERSHQPNANVAGGGGGGGGGGEDDNGASETGDGLISFLPTGQITSGDDAGAGGGGGGGGVWIIANTLTVAGTGVIRCDGGPGGNTYDVIDQTIFDPNGDPMVTNDEYVVGVVSDTAAGTGAGGGGGGGSGGSILLQARASLAVQAGATLSAVGGVGGDAIGPFDGGLGGDGRIGLMGFAGSGDDGVPATVTVDGGAVITPAAGVQGALWQPSTDLTSQGVSSWINLATASAIFDPPFWDDNAVTLTGGGLVAGTDFAITLEFQGADTLAPDSDAPTSGTGLTAWSTNVTSINNKLYFRWRFRFFVAKTFDEVTFPMPQVLSITIPFQK